MIEAMFCQFPDCWRKAKFLIFRVKTKEWLYLCSTHDSYVGIQNLVACGHTQREAKQINREVKVYRE